MNRTPFLLTAAIALSATPALAQHPGSDHGTAPDSAEHRFSSTAAAQAITEGTIRNGIRTVEIAVTDNGFEPSRVKANKGEKVRLVVTRKTEHTCAKELVIKEHGIKQPLPLDKVVTVEFTPTRSGEIRYACGMDHVSGIIFIP